MHRNRLTKFFAQIAASIHDFVKQNPIIPLFIFIYILLELSLLSWGIPNGSHPFMYHMDEWHQMNAVRALFKHGTSNVAGAANGPVFSFFLAGLYLIPFVLLGIIHPFSLHSALIDITEQARLFQVLRLETLFYGISSIVLLTIIVRRFFKKSPNFVLFFFIFSPIWLTLSNYFKYDIALLFWQCVTFFFFLKFALKPTNKLFVICGILVAVTLAVKISALPLLPLYLLLYLMFAKKRNIRILLTGLSLAILVFLIIGIPDIYRSRVNYSEFFYSNLVTTPADTKNVLVHMPYSVFYLVNQIPTNFGHILTALFFISLVYWIYMFTKHRSYRFGKPFRMEFFLFIAFLLYLLSLHAVGVFASGNRSLVLLPFIAFFSGTFLLKVMEITKLFKKPMMLIMIGLCFLQALESFSWIQVKWEKDPRVTSSQWLVAHIPKNTIVGVENVPIYEYLPDILLKDFYAKQAHLSTKYSVVTIDKNVKDYPPVVVLSNVKTTAFLKTTDKKEILNNLEKQGYTKVISFAPDFSLFHYFGTDLSFYLPNLIPTPIDITVYAKKVANIIQ